MGLKSGLFLGLVIGSVSALVNNDQKINSKGQKEFNPDSKIDNIKLALTSIKDIKSELTDLVLPTISELNESISSNLPDIMDDMSKITDSVSNIK